MIAKRFCPNCQKAVNPTHLDTDMDLGLISLCPICQTDLSNQPDLLGGQDESKSPKAE